jgi:DnaJ-class molecular chaperone
MVTVSDFQEIQPGVYKLNDHHVYVASRNLKEACGNCGGKGKAQSKSATGRKTWVKCGACYGSGDVNPLRNVERTVPKTGWSCQGMALSLDDAVKSLNSGVCGWLKQPSYIHILD